MRPALLLGLVLALAGCEGVLPGVDFQQMNDQHKLQPYEACRWFPDGRAMQSPPEATVPRDRVLGRPALTDGVVDGRYVERFPLPVTRALLDRGRLAFETTCAACHGLDGGGESEVARNMELRKPPSLVDEPARSFPVGRLYQVATVGYGLMPAYAIELDTDERWAAVAWLRTLQLAHAARLGDLPADVQQEAARALALPPPPQPEQHPREPSP